MANSKKLSVIIIDDNETKRAVLRMIIHGESYDVVGDVTNGTTGLERTLK